MIDFLITMFSWVKKIFSKKETEVSSGGIVIKGDNNIIQITDSANVTNTVSDNATNTYIQSQNIDIVSNKYSLIENILNNNHHDDGKCIHEDTQNSISQELDAKDQFGLGIMFYDGDSVEQDYQKAKEWYEKAAKQGDADAQCNLGGMFYNGHGVRQDKYKAFEWFEKAAEQGHAQAQYNLGIMYNNADGVEQDYQKAKEWYGKACDNGLQKGCNAYKKLNELG